MVSQNPVFPDEYFLDWAVERGSFRDGGYDAVGLKLALRGREYL
jgi:hypothetical protein